MSLLQQTLELDNNNDRKLFFEKVELLREQNQLAYDFNFRTPIDECFQDDNAFIPSLDIIFDHVLKCKSNTFYQNMLMRKMYKMISNEEICKPFFNFFHEANYESDLVNFESKCRGFVLDKFSGK